MDNQYEADLITLIDDEGNEHEFEIIDELENDDGHYMALVPTQQEPEEISSEAETYYIFEVVEEDGEEQLQEVEDDALLDQLAEIFESRFNDAYYDEPEEYLRFQPAWLADCAHITLHSNKREPCLRLGIADLPARLCPVAGGREREAGGGAPTCFLVAGY